MSNDKVCRELSKQGVFAGHRGLEGLADAAEFWERQAYGTRLYYGDGGMDYLHIGVLRSAINALRETDALRARLAEAEELVGDMVGVLRGHRFCGDDFPSNGWSEVNAVLARYAKFTRRPVNGRESP